MILLVIPSEARNLYRYKNAMGTIGIPRFTRNDRSKRATKNFGGRFVRPPLYFAFVSSYFFFFADFFFAAFLVAIVFYSPFSIVQSSSQRSFVAIVECIESLKNYVKQKMVDASCSLSSPTRKKHVTKVMRDLFRSKSSANINARADLCDLYFNAPLLIAIIATAPTIPSNNACAIIPVRRLFRKIAIVPKRAPRTKMMNMRGLPS